jgi:triosephosphate isomerase
VALGAQDCFWKNEDAYSGQIAPRMLADLGCTHAIVGHSEKRGRLGPRKEPPAPELLMTLADNDDSVNAKAKAALAEGLTPIICVGETREERDANQTRAVVARQVEKALAGLAPEQVAGLVMAYEPVWAIGAGVPCEPADAVKVIGLARETVRRLFGESPAESLRIQYGGTVKPDNVVAFMEYQQIDGGLVGGASLDPDGFAAIVRRAEETIKRQRR